VEKFDKNYFKSLLNEYYKNRTILRDIKANTKHFATIISVKCLVFQRFLIALDE